MSQAVLTHMQMESFCERPLFPAAFRHLTPTPLPNNRTLLKLLPMVIRCFLAVV